MAGQSQHPWYALVVCLLLARPLCAAEPDYASMPTEALVDVLTAIDTPAPGLDGTATYEGFIGSDQPPRFAGGIIGTPVPVVPPQMRELVRRGVAALPVLLAHLDDARPTRLVVGNELFMFRVLAGEYAPRAPACGERCPRREELREWSDFNGPYTVKVADVCFVLVGQIINRNFVAVRYQPTGGLVVNSPIETTALAARTRQDWGDLDAEGHQTALLADLEVAREPWFLGMALARLRHYFPTTYAALEGSAAEKRKRYEEAERGGRQ